MAETSYNVETVDGPNEIAAPEKTSKKPDNTAFKQQRLPAWQPILTPKSVLPTFFMVAIIFIPIGVLLLITSNNVVEASADYTECTSLEDSSLKCSKLRRNVSSMNISCKCRVHVNVDKEITGQVYVYYGLTNFFQNHRRYVKSRDDKQLVGEPVTADTVSSDCKPYNKRKRTSDGEEAAIAPCGAIANSFFNDTFQLFNSSNNSVSIYQQGIAWYTDHTMKFKNPVPCNNKINLTVAFSSYAQPFYWQRRVEELDPGNCDNNGYKNEALEVWMRNAAFPTFRKLYGKLNMPLARGNYSFVVSYNYPVTAFGGTKRIILSNTSFMGGKNNFLGIAYIVVGAFSFVVGIALSIVHCISSRKST